jgi:beta-aspartyl-peptidase (threonine type)
LVAEGAERFASQHGIELIDNKELVLPREVERLKKSGPKQKIGEPDPTFSATSSHDTVGAVACDKNGNIAAATSTGGTLNKTPGRVGDSSLIGCGCYADNESAAISCTGWGEPIMKLVLAKWTADRVAGGTPPDESARDAITYLHSRLNGHGGMIVVDSQGRFGIAHNTPRMAWAVRTVSRDDAGIEIS